MLYLAEHQLNALQDMKNGCILCGTVGSGKSRTSLAYYFFNVCGGEIKVNGSGSFREMSEPLDLYIITTAQKRDKHEWEDELVEFPLENVKVTIDSWNNIKKYKDVYGAFFIFDEQRVIGSGVWVKSFLNITRKNKWILLSATPGDKWKDYIPVFVANGFYRNKTDFNKQHVVYDPYVTKYPKIKGYVNEGVLMKHRKDILIKMKDMRHTERHIEEIVVGYNKELYSKVFRSRWDPYENKPIEEIAKMCFLLRRVVNSYYEREDMVIELMRKHLKIIIFYNHDYELNILRNVMKNNGIPYAEWNGHNHDRIPQGSTWAYLVQYNSGAEGWNCITTNAMIFYSQNYSYRTIQQSMGRIDRMNTPFTDLYYYIFRSNAPIDLAIKRAINSGKEFNERAFLEKNRPGDQKQQL